MRWLDDVERQAWLGLLVSFAGLERALDRQLQDDVGISLATYGVLAALSDTANGPRHMSDLAGVAGYSQSRLSHAVGRLEREGLLRREACLGDRRAVHAALTDQGRALMERAAPGHVEAVRRRVFALLTAEQTAALADITRAIYTGLVASGDALPLLDPPSGTDPGRPPTSKTPA